MTIESVTPRSGAQSLERALAVLACFETRPSVGVSQAARTLGLSVSTTHRLLRTLCGGGLLIQDPGGRYRLGPRTALLGSLASQRLGFDAARPALEALAAETGGAVTLGVLDAGVSLTVMTVASPRADGVEVLNGARSPLHACAMGKTLIAFEPGHGLGLLDAAGDGLTRVTDHTITDLDTLTRQLGEVRDRGWALNEGELFAGIRGVGAPVFAAGTAKTTGTPGTPGSKASTLSSTTSSTVTAAVAIAVPRSRASTDVPSLARDVRHSAGELRRLLAVS